MSLIDTHCHIHAAKKSRRDLTAKKWQEAGETDPDALVRSAAESGVDKLLCVGTDLEDSQDAVESVQDKDNCWASIGVHPHEAAQFFHAEPTQQRAKPSAESALSAHRGVDNSSAPSQYRSYSSVRASSSPSAASERERIVQIKELLMQPKVIAIGEVGLDYYYEHSPRKDQIKLLEMFLQLAADKGLPVIFHVRDAFDDFWPLLANFVGVTGVLHSFTSTMSNLDKACREGLLIGLNGIMTFTKDEDQLAMAKNVPLEHLVLETDAPYLAPKPHRGKICKPQYVKDTAEFLCELRKEKFDKLAFQTSKNATELFKLY